MTIVRINWTEEEQENFVATIKRLHESNPKLSQKTLLSMAMESFPPEKRRPWSGPMGGLVRAITRGETIPPRKRSPGKPPSSQKPPHEKAPQQKPQTDYSDYERHPERKSGPVSIIRPEREVLKPEQPTQPQAETVQTPVSPTISTPRLAQQLEQSITADARRIRDLEMALMADSQTIESLETMVFDKPDWVDQVADSLSRILIETACRFLESPAVRKGVRSLVKVATDPNFTPEIDNTEMWVKPAFGPKKPRVLVVGSPRGSFVQNLAGEFRDRLDLRFWKTDDSYHQLRADTKTAEIIIILASYTNHSVRQICVSAKKRLITLPISGSASRMKLTLEQLAKEFEAASAVPAGGG